MKKLIVIILLSSSIATAQVRKIVMPIEYVGERTPSTLVGQEVVNPQDGGISNITEGAIIAYLPESKKPTACVLIYPGGGYFYLNMEGVGTCGAEAFNAAGIATVVVKYRLPNGNYRVTLEDGVNAIRMVRNHAAEWNINPNKIGILGSSAGGHLASMLAVHHYQAKPSSDNKLEMVSSRPDFVVLLKAAITRSSGRSFQNMLGEIPDPDEYYFCNSLNHINKDTPPTFIIHSTVDEATPVSEAVKFYTKLVESGVPSEMHIFSEGGHGLGFAGKNSRVDEWLPILLDWKYIKKGN